MTIKTYAFHAEEPGPALAVLGSVHGNEKCGAAAINRLVGALESGHAALTRGTLLLMPIANPRAYELNKRFVERNLNRSLYVKATKVHYEDHLDPIICAFLDRADILLDLHSYTAGGAPFVFMEGTSPAEVAFARALGVADYVHGWEKAFGGADDVDGQSTTEKYMQSRGKIGVTLECGQHLDPDAPRVGYEAILRSLWHFGMLDKDSAAAAAVAAPPNVVQRCIHMQKVYYHEDGAVFAKPWRHLDKVAKGAPIALRSADVLFAAPADGYLILPKSQPKPGDEWIYFGVDSAFPA